MRFSIMQFQASREATDHVNSVGWMDAVKEYPEVEIMRDVQFMGGSDKFQPWMFKHYRNVANVEAMGLEDVFHIGNGYGDQEKIVRVDRMHSLSVGDIVLCHDTNTYFMCDPTGWTAINIREVA